MTGGALFWLLVLAAASALFFGIAIVVSIRGVADLRDLLNVETRTGRRRDGP